MSCPNCALLANKTGGRVIRLGPHLFHCLICDAWGIQPSKTGGVVYWGQTWELAKQEMESDGVKIEWMQRP